MSAPNTKSKLIYKVILLGNVGVGKTSMFKRLRDGSYEDEISSVGMDKHTKAFRMDNGKTVFVSDTSITYNLAAPCNGSALIWP